MKSAEPRYRRAMEDLHRGSVEPSPTTTKGLIQERLKATMNDLLKKCERINKIRRGSKECLRCEALVRIRICRSLLFLFLYRLVSLGAGRCRFSLASSTAFSSSNCPTARPGSLEMTFPSSYS